MSLKAVTLNFQYTLPALLKEKADASWCGILVPILWPQCTYIT